ncbi:serine hydrolase [Gemmatimonas sp.]|jgi:beta-lactamase class A|uniref:serine hydrolase n=1 Tax=Gemmatimonas sp. TaxID=1962908 RepID=UPI0037C01D88
MTPHTVKSAGIAAFVCVVVALRLATPLAAQPSSSRAASGLQRLLDAELARVPGTAGVWVKHLTTGEEAAVNADRVFNSASVIKIPVMLLAFQLADQGKLSLTERITIQAADVRGGSGVFRYHDAGLQPTLRDVLLQMIITSDNTATDLAIGKVGGIGPVNAMIKRAGYDPLQLTMTTGDLFAKYGALQATQRDDKTINDPTFWLGSMTPRATGRMLEDIQRCSDGARPAVASKAACADMLQMFRAQQSGARRLPHFLAVPVGHKTGDFPPVLANDVGIIYARSGPIVVAFFLNGIRGSYAEAEDHIGRVAQLIVEYFDGVQ